MPKTQAPADPLSGATVGEFQPDVDTAPRADLVTLPPVQPNMTVHDPVTFSGLTGQRMLEMKHAQNLVVTPDEINAIEDKALEDANNYHRTVAEQAQKERSQLGARQAAVASGILSAEEKTRAAVDIAKQQAQEQWKQGPSAAAVAAAQPGGSGAGEIKQLSDTDRKDFAGYFGAFNTIQNLHDLFHQMVQKTPGAGNVVTSLAGLTTPIANLTSDEARTYHAYAESSLVPLAKGVMGDAATAAAKDRIQANLLSGLPTMTDSLVSGGHKIYTLLDRNMNEMQTQRDLLRGNGYDTSSLDTKILDAQNYMKSPQVQMYNPFKRDAIVQSGTSDQANAAIANATTGANAGVQIPNQTIQQPQGQAGAYTTPPGYTQPAPPQSVLEQHRLATEAAQRISQNVSTEIPQIPGQVRSLAQTAVQHGAQFPGIALGTAAPLVGSVWNAIQNVMPENWPQQSFQQPRPWETTSQQFVGTQ